MSDLRTVSGEVDAGGGAAPSGVPVGKPAMDLAGPAAAAGVLVILGTYFAFAAPDGMFLLPGNLLGMAQDSAALAIVACGITCCLVAGEVDLSVAGVIGLSGVVVARILDAGVAWPVAVMAAIGAGAVVGIVNGVLTARVARLVRLFPSFLVTLATGTVCIGVAQALSPGNVDIPIIDPAFTFYFGFDSTLGGNRPLLYTAVVLVAAFVLLHKSAVGYRLYLVGSNAAAARLAGLDVRGLKFVVLALSGALAGFAGVIVAGFLSAGSLAQGDSGIEMTAIAAAVLGGTALFGGRGTILGTLLGVLVLGVLSQGVLLMQLTTTAQLLVTGLVILAAIALGEWVRRRTSGGRS
ncbi:MAG: ribose transport system permease protein [Mycobacterium sp.]|jgi:ribose transport system permease protein|nr:ribose transport system permease protein [Mycobacterium sp.]